MSLLAILSLLCDVGGCSDFQCEDVSEKNKLLTSQSQELDTLRSLGFTPLATTLSATATGQPTSQADVGADVTDSAANTASGMPDATAVSALHGAPAHHGRQQVPAAASAAGGGLNISVTSRAASGCDEDEQQQLNLSSSMRDVIHQKVCIVIHP